MFDKFDTAFIDLLDLMQDVPDTTGGDGGGRIITNEIQGNCLIGQKTTTRDKSSIWQWKTRLQK